MNRNPQEKLIVKVGIGQLDQPMTRAQAQRFGEKTMPRDLKAAGFKCVVSRSDPELHGGNWFRINYGGCPFPPLKSRQGAPA